MDGENRKENPADETPEEKESRKNREKIEKAQDKVDRMNYVFDKLIVPMLAFIVVFIVAVSLLPKDFNCYSCAKDCSESCAEKEKIEAQIDFYNRRNALTSNIEGNRSVFESNGWEVRDDLDVNPVAVKTLESGVVIKEYYDAQYYNRAILRCEREVSESDTGWNTIVMGIYAENCITVDVYAGGALYSTLFTNEEFTAWTRGDDFDAGRILSLATRTKLTELLDEYKKCLLPII